MQVVPFSTPLLCKLALQNPKKKNNKKKSKEIKPTNIKTGKNPDPETFISYKKKRRPKSIQNHNFQK